MESSWYSVRARGTIAIATGTTREGAVGARSQGEGQRGAAGGRERGLEPQDQVEALHPILWAMGTVTNFLSQP